MPGHEFTSEAKAKVIQAFESHGITLHIDTGNMGGGGEILSHVNNLPFSHAALFDFYNYKNGETADINGDGIIEPMHFNQNRRGIF